MKMRMSFVVTVAVLLMTTASPQATIHVVETGNFFFSPLKTTVQPGDTVRWVLVSGFHTSTSDPGSPKSWDSGDLTALPNQRFDLVFTAGDGPGPFPYHCSFHPFSMIDTIFMDVPATDPTLYTFTLNENEAADCVGTGSTARGFGLAILSPDSSQLSMYIVHDVAGVTDAHVHLGAPCVSGPIQFPFTSPASPIQETWSLSATDLTNLINGDLYVNVHSSAFPSGEIRGQIEQQEIKFLFNLDEAQAAGGTGTGSFASGFGVGVLKAGGTEFSIEVNHDVQNVTDGHIHLGAPGVSGAIQFPFSSGTSPISESWSLDTSDVKNLFDGNLYVNIHSSDFTGGEIRGQIVRGETRYALRLTEAEANAGAGTGSSAGGFAVLELNADQDSLSIYVEHDVTDVTDGHIHLGAPGVSGPVQFGFSSATSPISETWALTSADVNNLLAGDLYVNIHSTTFTGGEIRGQIDHDPVAVAFGLDEAQADTCNGTGSSATGTATVNLKAEGQEMTIAVSHDVASPTDAHLHLGFPCVGGPIQFPVGFTSPAETIWYLSTDDIANYLRGELYLNIHSTAFPAGEIRGQLAESESCCVGATGNVNADINEVVDISDLTALVNHLFVTFAPLACPAEANVNGDAGGTVDISDLTRLVNYLFVTFDPLASCP